MATSFQNLRNVSNLNFKNKVEKVVSQILFFFSTENKTRNMFLLGERSYPNIYSIKFPTLLKWFLDDYIPHYY